MKKMFLAVGLVFAVNAYAEENLPVIDLFKNFEDDHYYNLWDSGCRGITLRVPTGYLVTAYGDGPEGQCLTRDRVSVPGGYEVQVLTQLSHDEGVCNVKVKEIRGSKAAAIELSCGPT